jgi:hypothetical protein
VQSEHNELLYISQCIKEPVCSGNTFGNCPNFTNWSSKYQLIKPECSFTTVENCYNIYSNNTVDCYNSTNTDKDYESYGIYKCVDANTIIVNYNGTKLPSTQLPSTNKPYSNNKSLSVHIMIDYLCIMIIIIIILSLF